MLSAPPRPFRLAPLLLAALVGTMAMMAYVAIIGPVVRQLGISEMVAGISMSIGGVFWMLLARTWGRSMSMFACTLGVDEGIERFFLDRHIYRPERLSDNDAPFYTL